MEEKFHYNEKRIFRQHDGVGKELKLKQSSGEREKFERDGKMLTRGRNALTPFINRNIFRSE
jgi:hypothetical protein